jgi:hypothetical protein
MSLDACGTMGVIPDGGKAMRWMLRVPGAVAQTSLSQVVDDLGGKWGFLRKFNTFRGANAVSA